MSRQAGNRPTNRAAFAMKAWIASVALAAAAFSAHAVANLTVTEILVDGKPPKDGVVAVQVIRDGAAAGQRSFRLKELLEPGVEIIVPARTVIELTSVHTNRTRLAPGTRFKVNAVTSRGESHRIEAGGATFDVRRALDFFNVEYRNFLASVRGTIYALDVGTSKELKVTVSEGAVAVERTVRARVTGQDRELVDIPAVDVVRAGASNSFSVDPEAYLRIFKSFSDAELFFQRQLEQDEASNDLARRVSGTVALASVQRQVGKPRDALITLKRALELAEAAGDSRAIGSVLRNMAASYRDIALYSRDASPDRMLREALALAEKAVATTAQADRDATTPAMASALNVLGSVHDARTDYSQAIEAYERALDTQLRVFPDELDPEVASSLGSLGAVHAKLREYTAAIKYLQRALEIYQKLYPSGVHPDVAERYIDLGEYFVLRGSAADQRQAVAHLDRAIELQRALYPGGVHPRTARAYRALGNAWNRQFEQGRARESYERAHEIEQQLRRPRG